VVQEYINQLLLELATGNALEHSYRPALKTLFESVDPTVRALNEPSRSAHGAPDFAFYKGTNSNLVLGYVETKDLNVDLDQVEKTEQLKRYLGYANLILTNYIEFRFFRNGNKYQTVTIARTQNSVIAPIEENYPLLERELKAFLEGKPETITNAQRLAEIMGGKAARVKDNVIQYLKKDDDKNHELLRIFKIMQELLIKDLTVDKFADMYAQTLVYGLFIARYYDETPENFTRGEARDLIPASNPFLQHFFDHIAGATFDRRLTYIVDELCDTFSVSAVAEIVTQHYNLFGEVIDKDPVIHFYEDFLKEYDPLLRKNMGAYYTPVPVVQFIIHAVDDILKSEFDLPQGLADTTKIERKIMLQGTKAKQTLHKVQILDPAVGTATFLNETVKFIYKKFKNQEGLWESYVEKELLPRLHGFELMMAPYTIAHLKLAMTFRETGINHFDRRLGVYLTNSLEEGIKVGEDLFSFGLAEVISKEAKAASVIKHETPIMVVIGNPPYSGESFNKGAFAMKLVEKYKYEPGGIEKLKERNPKWINDDYVKFIAFAQDLISKTSEGIVAMITNHGYIDNPTFRGMRWQLTKTFSSIYILDLHGNAKKKEAAPDGGVDKNVFDIQQGVAIIVAVKHKTKRKELADVYKSDIWGTRKHKFDFLFGNTLEKIKWEKIRLNEPSYYFLNKDEKLETEYKKGIKINELFPVNGIGITTAHDNLVIGDDTRVLINKAQLFINFVGSNAELCRKLEIREKPGWNITKAREVLSKENNFEKFITPINYRPFDIKNCFYHENLVWRTVSKIMGHFLIKQNLGIVTCRQSSVNTNWTLLNITNKIVDESFVSNRSKERGYVFPLYLYESDEQNNLMDLNCRRPNINLSLVKQLITNIGEYAWMDDHEILPSPPLKKEGIPLSSINEHHQSPPFSKAQHQSPPFSKGRLGGILNTVSPLDILDYVYAVLHSPSYREKYKDFLKSDFPRVPVAKDRDSFWKLVALGGRLRRLHLMEDPDLQKPTTTYPIRGDNLIEKVELRGDRVFINDLQFFGDIPKEAWGFYIGGYQPAQKWLKDRKGKKLAYEDIVHYQKIITVIEKTIVIQKNIDVT